MRAYRRIWSTLTACLLTAICAAAGIAGPLLFHVALFILGTGAAAAVVALSPPVEARSTEGPPHVGHTSGPHKIVVSGAVLVASAALLDLSPWLLVAVAGTTALTHPGVASVLHSYSRNDPLPAPGRGKPPHLQPVASPSSPRSGEPCPTERLGPQVDAVFLDCLNTTELCRAWRQSFVWLQAAQTDEHRMLIVASRERYSTLR